MSIRAECDSESDVSRAIAEYESQLAAVGGALAAVGDGAERAELAECQQTLVELIAIEKDKLLNIKKAQLLSRYQRPANAGAAANPITLYSSDSEPEAEPSTSANNGNDNDNANDGQSSSEADAGVLASVIGSHCRVPLSTGGLRYHAGLIYDVVVNEDDEKDGGEAGEDDVKVLVLFTRPLRTAMKPCEHFLNNRCRFGDKCRYSHGRLFYLSQLLQEEEKPEWHPSPGDKCLLRPVTTSGDAQVQQQQQQHRLWRVGEITCLDGGKAAVRLAETGDESEAELQNLEFLSLDDFEQASEGNDAAEDDVSNNLAPLDMDVVDDDDEERRLEKANSAFAVGQFASWEQHSRGIASKLMSKMGYVAGEGLGKRSQGRLEPVETKFCPKGKSLDKCMQLRQMVQGVKKADGSAMDNRDILKLLKSELRRKKTKDKKRAELARKQNKEDVFDFLNQTLAKKNGNAKSGHKSAAQMRKELNETSDRQLNVKLLQADERIAAYERDILRYEDNMGRLLDKDPNSVAKYRASIQEARAKIAAVHRKKYQLANEKSKREGEKKLSVF